MPYLAHAAMEPLNCVIAPDGDGVRVMNGEQFQTADQAAVAGVLGLKPEQVRIDASAIEERSWVMASHRLRICCAQPSTRSPSAVKP